MSHVIDIRHLSIAFEADGTPVSIRPSSKMCLLPSEKGNA